MKIVFAIMMACLNAGITLVTLSETLSLRIKIFGRHEDGVPVKTLGARLYYGTVIASGAIGFLVMIRLISGTNNFFDLCRMTILLFCLTGAACIDYREHRIPNIFPLSMLVSSAALSFFAWLTGQPTAKSFLFTGIITMCICAVFLTVASFLTKKGIGAGDIKLLSTIGLIGGAYALCGILFFSILSCALFASVLLLLRKKTIQDAMPYGPFVLLGYIATVLTLKY